MSTTEGSTRLRPMRVMLDTNVLVPALAPSRLGVCAQVLWAVVAGHHLVVGTTGLAECERVLAKKKMKAPAQRVRGAIAFLTHHAEVIRPTEAAAWPRRDPDDRWIVAAALEGRVDVLVSGDKDILEERQTELKTTSPAHFLDLLRDRHA